MARSRLDRILNFQPRPPYTTKYEDPLYRKLVAEQAREDAATDANNEGSQSRRNYRFGSLATGGKPGIALDSHPAFAEED